MNKVIYINPEKSNSSEISWKINLLPYKFDSNFAYKEAIVFLKKKIVVVFHNKNSDESKFLGKVFSFGGVLKFDIPYPSLGANVVGVNCMYSWSSEIEDGLKIVFITNSQSYQDFWCDYNIDERRYGNSNTSR